jgi:dipeptidyl aminopeptidase/acylaminoacyl peptidase
LYKQSLISPDSTPVPLTPDYGGPIVRYADGVFDLHLNRYLSVREDYRGNAAHPTTEIVSIDLNGEVIREPKVLLSGNDFYAFPRLDPKGERLAWIEWSHPNMHWDKAELWVGYISETGDVHKRVCIGGADPAQVESPTEPKWSPKGELYFITDRHMGFWNIYKWIEEKSEVHPVYSLDAEFTRPLWVFGISSFDFIFSNEQTDVLACCFRKKGRSYLGVIDEVQSSMSTVDIPFTYLTNIISGNRFLYTEGASATHPMSLAKVAIGDQISQPVDFQIIWSCSSDIEKYGLYFSSPELIEFPTDMPEKNAYAYYYPPCNPHYQATQEEKPPLLLESHGGPTDEAHGILNLTIQYWTSRGWAFVEVNYGGSTGYGREYRERLLGYWGVMDVNDCCACAEYLVEDGKVDSERLCITGCSAGGYTTLASLAFMDTFKAGASLFGIADLKSLKEGMHKFESHYIDNLLGCEEALFEGSPINFIDKFSCPIILFQGLDDQVVNPEQARKIYAALKRKGLPVALVEYEGESHGFRKAENIKFTLEQQMLFFARTVGHFTVADEITPIRIDNFD